MTVSVFETNIRIVGGLISGHVLAQLFRDKYPGTILIYITVGKFTKAWGNLQKCGKIYKSVGKFTKAWENLNKCGKIYKSIGKFT